MSVWSREWRRWAGALAFLLVNAVALVTYFAAYSDRGEVRTRQIERQRERVETQRAELERVRALLAQAESNADQLHLFYGDRLGSESARFTTVVAEIKELAGRAGLDPRTIRYPDEPLDEFGLVTHLVNFTVDGTYQQLRRFLNFLELSDSFLILQELRPSGRNANGRLRINLRIAALFVQEGVDPAELAEHRRQL